MFIDIIKFKVAVQVNSLKINSVHIIIMAFKMRLYVSDKKYRPSHKTPQHSTPIKSVCILFSFYTLLKTRQRISVTLLLALVILALPNDVNM